MEGVIVKKIKKTLHKLPADGSALADNQFDVETPHDNVIPLSQFPIDLFFFHVQPLLSVCLNVHNHVCGLTCW